MGAWQALLIFSLSQRWMCYSRNPLKGHLSGEDIYVKGPLPESQMCCYTCSYFLPLSLTRSTRHPGTLLRINIVNSDRDVILSYSTIFVTIKFGLPATTIIITCRVTRGNSVVGVIRCYGCKFDLYHRIAPKEAKKSILTSPHTQLDGIKYTTVSHFSILGFTYKYTGM